MQQTSEPLISVAEAARRIGLNRTTLGRQIASGAIRHHGGKVRFSEVLADRARNVDPGQSRLPAGHPAALTTAAPIAVGAAPAPGSLAASRLARVRATADLLELKFRQKAGRLVDAAAFLAAAREMAVFELKAWAAWPARIAPALAAELGCDPERMRRILQRHMDEMLATRPTPDEVVDHLASGMRPR